MQVTLRGGISNSVFVLLYVFSLCYGLAVCSLSLVIQCRRKAVKRKRNLKIQVVEGRGLFFKFYNSKTEVEVKQLQRKKNHLNSQVILN